MTTATEYANGLRELADWIEAHPDIERPEPILKCCSWDDKAQAAQVLLALKPCRKEYSNSLFYIARDFGPLTLKYVFNRDRVCVRRVVGTEEIEEQVIPAKPEEIIPAHTKDIIEWDCDEPLMTAIEQKAESDKFRYADEKEPDRYRSEDERLDDPRHGQADELNRRR